MKSTKARVALAALPIIAALFDDALAVLPTQLQPLIQDGYIERSLEDYAEPENEYAALADLEQFEEHIGTTLTKTRPGLKAPIQIATTAANAADDGQLNNGITPSDVSVEQYTLTPATYEDGMDLDLIGTNFAIVDRFEHNVKTNIIQSYQSRDLLARDTIINGYAQGRSKGLAAGSAVLAAVGGASATWRVDDIRGLQDIVFNGKLQSVSDATNLRLAATVFPNGSMTGAYNVVIAGAAADGTNATGFALVGSGTPTGGATATPTRGNGVSGTLTVYGAAAGLGANGVSAISGVGKTPAAVDIIDRKSVV